MAFGALAGAALGGLAGAFGGKKGAKPATSSSKSFVDEDQAGFLKDKYAAAMNVYEQNKGLNAMQQQGQQMGQDFYTGAGQEIQQSLQAAGQGAMSGMQGATDFQNYRPEAMQMNMGNVQREMDNPIVQRQMDAIQSQSSNMLGNQLSGLRQGAAGRGMVGSSRDDIAQGVAAAGVSRDMASQMSDLQGGYYQAGLGREQQRMSQEAGRMDNNAMQRGQMGLSQFGAGTQAMQSSYGMGAGAGQGMAGLGALNSQQAFGALGAMSSALGQTNILNESTSTGAVEGEESMFGKIMGGMSGGASALGGI